MYKTLVLLAVLASCLTAQIRIRRIAVIPSGLSVKSDGRVVCCDSDHDSLDELIFRTGTIYPGDCLRWEVWEYRPVNRFELVFADTGAYPPRPGIIDGNFRPWDVGDIDQDGLIDMVGHNEDWVFGSDTFMYNVLAVYESPDSLSFPQDLKWSYRYAINHTGSPPIYITDDMDRDSSREILTGTTNVQIGTGVWECEGNDRYSLVWAGTPDPGWSRPPGDIDGDGIAEWVTASASSGIVSVMKNTGRDQYELVYRDTTGLSNGSDVFIASNVDGRGTPMFFVGFWVVPSNTFYLYGWRATGTNSYQRVAIDRKTYSVSWGMDRVGKCGDIDGDGADEVIWATPLYLDVYKWVGPDQFQRVWEWYQDHGDNECLITNVADVNNDGYNEIIVSGSWKTSIFEVEAVQATRPQPRELVRGGHGSTAYVVAWRRFYPPRCDSFSLFYTIDNGRSYVPIALGLSPNDTTCPWVVPNVRSDSCKIKVVAFGPGTQFDETDSCFCIVPTGAVYEIPQFMPETRLADVQPNPVRSHARVSFSLHDKARVRLQVSDVSGRIVATIANGVLVPGCHSRDWEVGPTIPNGVYFLEFVAPGYRATRKLTLTR